MFIKLPGLNVKIMAVEVANYAVAKKKPKKIQACRDWSPDVCDTGAAF